MLLIDELLNVNFDKHCRDCPYRDNNDIWKRFNDYVDSVDVTKVIANPEIANDLDLLQKHYTILLDYCYDLEDKNRLYKEKLGVLDRQLYWKDRKINKLKEKNESLNRQLNNIIKLDISERRRRKKNGICDQTQKR